MTPQAQVYIGLGSNLSDPLVQIQNALSALARVTDTQLITCSSLYSSKPMGPQNQPDYVNAVALLYTNQAPIPLLRSLQKIELEHGRERKDQRWGPRSLDLDMLLYGQEKINSPDLVVPHYGMLDRDFVLYPLAEIAPDLVLPGGEILKNILNNCPSNGLSKLPLELEICEFSNNTETVSHR